MVSRSKIDKSGRYLTEQIELSDVAEAIDLENLFDEYRKSHLQPLSENTIEIQRWLVNYGGSYYMAQRLKRKPQIIRKLKRLSVRLTQLQDIGGCRIIVDSNKDVDSLLGYLNEKLSSQSVVNIKRATDYRLKGRDDSGYRAVHLIFERAGKTLELQIRSSVQHYWAENIERTSVIYGNYIKEGEGDHAVISYFKKLSDIFSEIEYGREPSNIEKLRLDELRIRAENIIQGADNNKILKSVVNEDIIKTLIEKEQRNPSGLNNWILVFDWSTGNFVSWDIVGRNPDDAVRSYIQYENSFPSSSNFEVVLIGSSDVATVRQTHSHYFGIESYDEILENLPQAIARVSNRMDIDIGSRKILNILSRKRYWGNRIISIDTLRNHYCQDVQDFQNSLNSLIQKDFIVIKQDAVSLNLKNKSEIDNYT